MASWADVERQAPELAALARRCFDAHPFKLLATLRKDGSPRISGVEVEFRDGELWTGSMPNGVKALDARRDPRFALHSTPVGDLETWTGDAKVAGRLVEEPPPEGRPSHVFRAELSELVVVHLSDDRKQLLVDSWHEGRGLRRRTR